MARKKVDEPKITVGNIADVIGEVNIATGDIYKGFTSEQVSVLIKQITTSFQPKKFDGRCPYKGLDVFEEEDAELFFGREELVEDLVSRVKESKTVFITGPSGSGKSSLVRAGLIYVLKQGAIKNSDRWLYETIKPGRDPIESLALAFSRVKSPELANYFRQHVDKTDILHECAESALSNRKEQRLVLFIDQFEEAFTQVDKDKAEEFINILTNTSPVENGRVIILFSMRSDFVSNCAVYPQLNALLNQQFIQIGAMQPDELVSAIAQPALRVGLHIDPDLVAQIINDMQGEPGALPLMQFALKDLFDSQHTKGGSMALDLNNYLKRGGIHKALERHANASFAKLDRREQELARSIFSSLIEIGHGTQDTRRTALFDELAQSDINAVDIKAVIQKLADARLITTDEQTGKYTITISHEKIIDAWPWLKKLIDVNRDAIRLQNEIASDAIEWNDNRQDKSYLYTGARLAKVRKQLLARNILLTGMAKEFVKVGVSRQRFSKLPAITIMMFFITLISFVSSFVYDYVVSARINADITDFYSATSPAVRLSTLASIYQTKGIWSDNNTSFTASQLFYSLNANDQLALFNNNSSNYGYISQDDLVTVISHLYVTFANVFPENDSTELLYAMLDALQGLPDNKTSGNIQREIWAWLDGRDHAHYGDYIQALSGYDVAIGLNPTNPSTLYERAKIYVSLRHYENALLDLDSVIGVAKQYSPESELAVSTPTMSPPTENVVPSATNMQITISSSPSAEVTTIFPKIIETFAITPTLMSTQIPIVTMTASPINIINIQGFESNFTTSVEVVSAVRALKETTPQLQDTLQASKSNYPNLASAGLVKIYYRVSTNTPSPIP